MDEWKVNYLQFDGDDLLNQYVRLFYENASGDRLSAEEMLARYTRLLAVARAAWRLKEYTPTKDLYYALTKYGVIEMDSLLEALAAVDDLL